ncbi:MAG: DUF917 domain-containing protein [Firmicutes bacterium]|nr:DUF917 domain-containing protein [Bacillota bacterium]
MKKLGRRELENITYGATFFGAGGGGCELEGLGTIDLIFKEDPNAEVAMIDVEEIQEKEVAATILAMGSPAATKGKLFEVEGVKVAEGTRNALKADGKELKYIYSGEMGGGNTLLPIYVAFKLGMPLVDTDGQGRAVPELNTSLQPLHKVPTSPVILASESGDTIVVRLEDAFDSQQCEKVARALCVIYGQGIGISMWSMDKEQLMRGSVTGQMTRAVETGEILRTSGKDDVVENLERYFKGRDIGFKELVRGEITDIQMDAAGGFDNGTTKIRKQGTGEEYKVFFQNENLFVKNGEDEVMATVPGLIIVLNRDTQKGLSNTETGIGMNVSVLYIEADRRWYDIPDGYTCWKGVLETANYTGDEVNPCK